MPFDVTFHDPGKGDPVKDSKMEEKLTAELPGISPGRSVGAFLASKRTTRPQGRADCNERLQGVSRYRRGVARRMLSRAPKFGGKIGRFVREL